MPTKGGLHVTDGETAIYVTSVIREKQALTAVQTRSPIFEGDASALTSAFVTALPMGHTAHRSSKAAFCSEAPASELGDGLPNCFDCHGYFSQRSITNRLLIHV